MGARGSKGDPRMSSVWGAPLRKAREMKRDLKIKRKCSGEKNLTRVVLNVMMRFAFVIKTARDDSIGVSLGCEYMYSKMNSYLLRLQNK